RHDLWLGISHGLLRMSRFFSIYILSPSVAFETLTPESGEYWGANTFPFFYILLNHISDFNYDIVLKLKEFVYVPLPTNVYTIMQPYYEDFGFVGVFIFGIINGSFIGFIYRRAIKGKPISKCLYVYLLQILILQFFQENLFVSLSVLIQILFWSYLLVGNLSFFKIKKHKAIILTN
ncbi:MAG: oligosaccharide repeat unit polymerase, partial [Ruminococcus sp.]|nr:oligosaccharide repeat unit polymerase [Ruminococcus sp.]